MEDITNIDKEKNLILLYNNNKKILEDKTKSIESMSKSFYYGNFTGYNIYFKGTKNKFFYKEENVVILYLLKVADISNKDVYVNGQYYPATKVELFDRGYYRVHFNNESILTKKLELKPKSTFSNKDIFTYYKDLATHAESIASEDEPLYFLSQNYKRIIPHQKSVLFQFFSGVYNKQTDQSNTLVPFDFNQSQYKAIKIALTNSISVIEGPPGTGKTQTILNLISNIIYRKGNCAVVSNNNTAIDNIYEKLCEEGISYISATLGRKDNVIQFFESKNNDDIVELLSEPNNYRQSNNTNIDLKTLTEKIQRIQELELLIAKLDIEYNEIMSEKRLFDQYKFDYINLHQYRHSKDYFDFLQRIEKRRKIKLFERFFLNHKFGIKLNHINLDTLILNVERLFYEKRIIEIQEKIKNFTMQMTSLDKNQVTFQLKRLSKNELSRVLYNHYNNLELTKFTQDSYKLDYTNFLLRYPVILSTSQSLLNNAPKGFLFDYLIIDEASQGDLLSSVLAMSCAKKVVVVGDSRQLQQIEEERLFEQSEILSKKYDIPKPYRYEDNSILMSIKAAVIDVPTTLLREHYRCAPDIIGFCNKMFYNNELIPMTKNTGKHIEIIKTVPGNHARKNPFGSGLYNQREIDEVISIINEKNQTSLGIITPFRYQANLIQKSCNTALVEADTIHKFQGRQKDEVILSFVVNSLDRDPDNIESKLYDFVTNKKLLNVAISRGKNKVTAIVSDKLYYSTNNIIVDFIKYAEYLYGESITTESNITSVFDYLYSEHTNVLITKYKDSPNSYKTELLMCDLINEVLNKFNYFGYAMHIRLSKLVNTVESFSEDEIRYIKHPWTHVDFLFYNKVSKERLFVLEVDGIRYHEQDVNQRIHDDIKNRVLALNNIPIYRFRTNESNERNKLITILNQYSH